MPTMVRHPAALVHVPPGSRRPRVSFVACTTPVALAEADPRDLAPLAPEAAAGIGFSRGGPVPQVIEGTGPVPWVRLVDYDRNPVSARRFLQALATGGDKDLSSLVAAGSPVHAWGHPDSTNVPASGAWTTRGEEMRADRIGRVERDDRGIAADAVGRWLSRSFRIVGDDVMARMALVARGYAGGVFHTTLYEGRIVPRVHHPSEVTAGGADYPAALAYANAAGRVGARGSEEALAWGAIVGDADAGLGAALAADGMPVQLRRIIRRCHAKRRAWGDEAIAEELKAAGDALVPLEIDGITGLHACGVRTDPGAALRALRDAARLVASHPASALTQEGRNYDYEVNHAHALAHAIDGFYLPSIPAPAPPREDAEAMAALVP